jgi:hypothetical protein
MDELLSRQIRGSDNKITPRMQNTVQDSITGQPVKYTPVVLSSYGVTVMTREGTDAPQSVEPPKTVGD